MSRNGKKIDVWTAPTLLGVASAVGLIAALLSDDTGDWIGWLTLAAPVAIVLWFLPPRRTE